MRIVFFGTPYYVLPILESLHKNFKEHGVSPIEAVVTQPPKPTGRKQIVEYSPVDKWAHEKKVPIYFDSNKLVKDGIYADLGVLASYGALIPDDVIAHFPKGILVIHPSLLPEFRGSSPVPAMIATNSENIGCSIFKLDNKLDHGPIVTQFRDEVLSEDNYQSLRDRLFERSADVITQAIPAYLSGKIKLKAQDDTKASFARMISKEDSFIEPKTLNMLLNKQPPKEKSVLKFIKQGAGTYSTDSSPEALHNFIRAMSPQPGAWTNIKLGGEIKRMKIIKSAVENTSLVLKEVQLEGKNPVSWEQFKQGYPDAKFN